MEINKILCQDCMEGMKLLPDKSIDMILCDLPYGITNCDWDIKLPTDELWKIYNRIIKDNGVIVLTATMKYAIELINGNKKHFRYDLVWEKTKSVGFANAKKMPLRKHELILVFYKRLPTYNPQGLVVLKKPMTVKATHKPDSVYKIDTQQNTYTKTHTNYPKSILSFPNHNNKSVHPTQKPTELFKYLIKTYSNEGDLILDNCVGSGTTPVACIETGRNFIGFETNERYFEMANKRIEDAIVNVLAM